MTDAQTRAIQERMRNFVNNYAPADVVERMNTTAPKFKARPTTKPAPKAKQDAGPSSPQEAQSVAAAVGMMHGLLDAMSILATDAGAPHPSMDGEADDRLAELKASNPRISDERLPELSHLFRDNVPDPSELSDGLPDDYAPGHED